MCIVWSECCGFTVLVLFGLGQPFMKWSSSKLKHFVGGFDLLIWALQSTVLCDFER